MTVVTYFEKIKNLMDDVSGLADKSNGFTNFLTVSRKFGYICLHIFHIIYLTKSIWQMILSQTKIFNIFPSTIQLGNIPKILTNNWDRDTINYIPANTFIPSHDLWINRFYLSLSNKSKYCCLTIDCRELGPAKYRTEVNLNNFVIMDKVKWIGFLIKFWLKRSIKMKIL